MTKTGGRRTRAPIGEGRRERESTRECGGSEARERGRDALLSEGVERDSGRKRHEAAGTGGEERRGEERTEKAYHERRQTSPPTRRTERNGRGDGQTDTDEGGTRASEPLMLSQRNEEAAADDDAGRARPPPPPQAGALSCLLSASSPSVVPLPGQPVGRPLGGRGGGIRVGAPCRSTALSSRPLPRPPSSPLCVTVPPPPPLLLFLRLTDLRKGPATGERERESALQ